MEDYTCRPMSSSILTPSLVAISGLEGKSGAVSIRSYAKKNLPKPKFKQESVPFMPPK